MPHLFKDFTIFAQKQSTCGAIGIGEGRLPSILSQMTAGIATKFFFLRDSTFSYSAKDANNYSIYLV